MDRGDANFACDAGGVPCALTVTVKDGVASVTSNGGVATATNSATALSTIEAIAISDDLIPGASANTVAPVIPLKYHRWCDNKTYYDKKNGR